MRGCQSGLMEEAWKLVLEFPDKTPSYAEGFDHGQVWQEMRAGAYRIERTILKDRLPFIVRMADVQFYEVETEELDGDWITLKLTKSAESPVKKRLKLVD